MVCAIGGLPKCAKFIRIYAVVTLFKAVGYCWFWWCFIRKVWSVDHIIIHQWCVSFQFWNNQLSSGIKYQRKAFLIVYSSWQWTKRAKRAGGSYFKPGVPSGYCCVRERGYCNGVCYRGSSEMCQIHTQGSHFWRLLVTCCWYLLPPKLQRRGLVFKGKLVTMKRVWWVTMMRV